MTERCSVSMTTFNKQISLSKIASPWNLGTLLKQKKRRLFKDSFQFTDDLGAYTWCKELCKDNWKGQYNIYTFLCNNFGNLVLKFPRKLWNFYFSLTGSQGISTQVSEIPVIYLKNKILNNTQVWIHFYSNLLNEIIILNKIFTPMIS